MTYTVRPKSDCTTGTVITNYATIVFDTQEPIDTNDVSTPSTPLPRPAQWPPCRATPRPHRNPRNPGPAWTIREGSGLADYTVYVSIDGGPYTVWLDRTTLTEATYTGQLRPHLCLLQPRPRQRRQRRDWPRYGGRRNHHDSFA